MRRDPQVHRGMRIGLFGGSFDPAHSGHRHVANVALRALCLDRVWWLVTPQNPLKPKSTPLARRMASARSAARGRRHVVTDIESRLGVQYTVDTLRALKRRHPGVRFVLLVGGDVLGDMHRWRSWRAIFAAVPIAVVARTQNAGRLLRAPAFARMARARRPAADATRLAELAPPAWLYLNARLDPASSTALRLRKG